MIETDYVWASKRVHQVWSILMEFLSDLSEEDREKLLVLAYDDMCHLKVLSVKLDMGGIALMVISPKKMGIFALPYVHIMDYSTIFEVV